MRFGDGGGDEEAWGVTMLSLLLLIIVYFAMAVFRLF